MRGFTLIEIVIGTVIAGAVSLAAWYFISLVAGDPVQQGARQVAQAELDDLVTLLRHDWRARSAGASFSASASTAFDPASGCSDLSLKQKNAAGADVTVTFITACAPGQLPSGTAMVHPNLSCESSKHAEIQITRGAGSVRTIPNAVDVIAAAACFRVTTDGVVAELGALSRSGRRVSGLLVPLLLSVQDRSSAVQILAN